MNAAMIFFVPAGIVLSFQMGRDGPYAYHCSYTAGRHTTEVHNESVCHVYNVSEREGVAAACRASLTLHGTAIAVSTLVGI